MTRVEFSRLRKGDVIRMGRSLRTVLCGPADGFGDGVVLPKLTRSWRHRPTTTYLWNDIKQKIVGKVGRTKAAINGMEFERLSVQGFDNPELALLIEEVDHDAAHLRVKYGWDLP